MNNIVIISINVEKYLKIFFHQATAIKILLKQILNPR